MTSSHPDILIVGAGPSGLALACVLARSGVSVRIVEASPEPQTASRAKGVSPRTLELFDDLGIADQVLANGILGIAVRQHDGAGAAVTAPMRDSLPRPDAPYLSPLLTPQWRIEEALRRRLADFGGAVEFGVTLSGYEQDNDGVTAVLVGPGGEQKVRAAWLVGCDGARSLVRQAAGIAFLGETREQIRMMLGDVRLSGLDRDAWSMWRSPEGFLGLCPLPSTDLFQLQASIAPGQEDVPSHEAFQRIIERRTARDDIRVEATGWMSMWRANVRMVDRYRDGRVLLAGDAAHVHSPAGGQGMNTGIQDACNLGWKLAAVLTGVDAGLIDTYQAERLPVAAHVLGLSDKLLNSAIATGTMMGKRDEETLQLSINYRDSALSEDSRPEAEGLRAGDRAPDAPGLLHAGRTVRLFDLLRGPQITLLGFGPRWRPAIDACEAAFGSAVRGFVIAKAAGDGADVVDHQSHAYAAYADDALFVIRPDNYVGLVLADLDQASLLDYLRRIAVSQDRKQLS